MKALWLKLLGVSKVLWEFLWPLLKSKVGEFLADERVQSAAKEAALAVAGSIGKSNNEKAVAAVDHFKATCKLVGIEYSHAWASVAVEAAFQKLKADGKVH